MRRMFTDLKHCGARNVMSALLTPITAYSPAAIGLSARMKDTVGQPMSGIGHCRTRCFRPLSPDPLALSAPPIPSSGIRARVRCRGRHGLSRGPLQQTDRRLCRGQLACGQRSGYAPDNLVA
jgi:hypothetical protein